MLMLNSSLSFSCSSSVSRDFPDLTEECDPTLGRAGIIGNDDGTTIVSDKTGTGCDDRDCAKDEDVGTGGESGGWAEDGA
ncbi:hypothetical protein BGZ46_000244 [Entomortierella lignicola]|nr:hypothetical protein BGZ46_000244 [Entomortierella lignicola]